VYNLQHNNERIKRKMSFIHEKIFNMCVKHIKYKDKIGDTSCIFEPPERISGEVDYELSECLIYLIKKLRAGGFTVFYKHPSNLFIVWEPYAKYKRIINDTKYLYNENQKTEKFYKSINEKDVPTIVEHTLPEPDIIFPKLTWSRKNKKGA